MSSKKKHRKKSFKRSTSRSVLATVTAKSASAVSTVAPVAVPAATAIVAIEPTSEQDLRLVRIKRDVRRALVLAGGFIVLQLVLWYVFGHTSLGSSIYKL
jgi:hypothetical protein